MIRLKLYGQPSSTYEYIKMMIKDNAHHARVELDITEVNDVQTFIEDRVNRIPAAKVNDEEIIEYANRDDINEFIKNLTQMVIDESDYQTLPKIIVPIDFSNTSENAFHYAINYAKAMRTSINLVHSYTNPLSSVAAPAPVSIDITNSKKEQLKKFKNKVASQYHANLPVIKEELLIGEPIQTVLSMVTKGEGSVIIIGSQGTDASYKLLFGSVSIGVAQKANCPVFIIPPDAKFTRPDFVAYAYQKLDNHHKELDFIGELAMTLDSYLYLIHVDSSVSSGQTEGLTSYIEKKYPNLNSFKVQIVNENTVKGIQQFIESNDIEFLAVSRVKSNFLQRLLHKSVSKRLMINTTTPLLVLHHN